MQMLHQRHGCLMQVSQLGRLVENRRFDSREAHEYGGLALGPAF